ncbi:MAG: DUF4214 domain-containing protein [Clostridium sp.]|nr:DUF4214 domain-containing protein [Clostridium sp.]
MDSKIKKTVRNVKYILSVIICFALCFNGAASNVYASELFQETVEEGAIATDTDAEIEVGLETESEAEPVADEGVILIEDEQESELYGAAQTCGTINVTGTRRYDYAYQVLDIVNQERAANGLSPLSMDVDLLEAAMKRAAETSVYWSHTRPNGSSCFTISSKMQAENIAASYGSPASVMNGWMNSSGHRANILRDTKTIGVGCFYHNGTLWWVQVFGWSGSEANTVSQPQNRNVTEQIQADESLLTWENIEMQASEAFNVGTTQQIVIVCNNPEWMAYVADGSSFNWQSSNPKIATVDASGNVTVKSNGAAMITAVLKTSPYTKLIFLLNTAGQSQEIMDIEAYEKIEGFVIRLYDKCLDRVADDEGMGTWTSILLSKTGTGASVAKGFVYSKEYIGKNVSDEEYLNMLYRVFLDREADVEGRNTWLGLMEQGLSRDYVFRGFVESPEYTNLCESYGIERGTVKLTQPRDKNPNMTKFVNRLYAYVLERNGEADGLNDWCQALQSKMYTPVQVGDFFVLSPEFQAKNLSDEEYIKVLYRAYLGREYDEEGLNTWLNELASGKSREQVLRGFTNSVEFRGIINSFGL